MRTSLLGRYADGHKFTLSEHFQPELRLFALFIANDYTVILFPRFMNLRYVRMRTASADYA